jgi:hypothetical protein
MVTHLASDLLVCLISALITLRPCNLLSWTLRLSRHEQRCALLAVPRLFVAILSYWLCLNVARVPSLEELQVYVTYFQWSLFVFVQYMRYI